MGVNLQLLGIQAIPRLAKKFRVHVEFPEERMIFGMSPEDFQKLLFKDAGDILARFFHTFKASWWDVYNNSDIGMERVALAQEMQLQKSDVILDVGCGRGYFSIAAARFSKFIVGLDLMNGFGRQGWWRNFRISMRELNLSNKVFVRSDARSIPFNDSSFTKAVAVHSIRNFPNKNSIERAIGEMKRVVTRKGNVIIVESLPIARTRAQEAHLQMFRCKVKCTSGELDFLPEKELVEMFYRAGFSKIEVKQLNYNLSATPPFFYLDSSSLADGEREEAKKAYDRAINMIKKWGDASPPAVFVKATK